MSDGTRPDPKTIGGNGASVDRTAVDGATTAAEEEEIRPPAPSQSFGRWGAAPGERSENFKGTSGRLLAQMRPEGLKAVAAIVMSIVSVTLAVLGPKLLGHATDIIVQGAFHVGGSTGIDFTELGRTLLFIAGLYIVSATFQYLSSYVLAGVVQRTMFRLREQVEEKLHRLSLGYVDGQPRGDLLSRVTNDIDNIAQSLQQTLSQLLTSTLTIVGVMVMMFIISPILALIALITIPLSLVLVRWVTNRSRPKFAEQWRYTGDLNAQVEEGFTGHSLVKVFGQRATVEERFNDTNEHLYKSSFRAQFLAGTVQPVMMFLGNINFVAIAVIGGLKVSTGQMTIGDIQAFIQYSRQFTQPLTQLAAMINVLQSGMASAERVFELLDVDEQSPEPDEPMIDERPAGRVVFDHVSFSYDPAKPLIEDLSLVAEPGQTIAIVGPTGAGKTTLVNLIMRFYDIGFGTISLDGIDTRLMDRSELRENIGMVLQDTWLFSGTIRENIGYGNLDATDERILEAAKATYVDRFVHSLPDGYDTILDDEGTTVSAGEKQLLTIARAFLANPTILILDEATSSVDTRTEVLIQRAMAALRSNRTSFVIAHRLSTIRDADLILVMEHGSIVEQGTHLELLEAEGAYWRLYNAQFTGAMAEEEEERLHT
jgi:ATP-binding cassette subfamily B protein